MIVNSSSPLKGFLFEKNKKGFLFAPLIHSLPLHEMDDFLFFQVGTKNHMRVLIFLFDRDLRKSLLL